jgi:hypothetical protein
MKHLTATPDNMRALAQAQNEPIAAKGIFSYCPDCGAEYSASPGDYFNRLGDKPLVCEDGAIMLLASRKTVIKPIISDN